MASEEFKQLLEEQKKTNDLLTLANKDPSLGSSIRQNLGEILNASRLAAQNEAFSRREGITQTDDITEDVRDFVADANKIAIESDEVNSVLTRSTNAELVFIREGIAVLGTQLNRMLKDMDINRVVKRLDEITPDPDQLLKAI